MNILKRIKFVIRQYCGLLPSIWHSWRAPAYPPPSAYEVAEFMRTGFGGEPVSLTQTCHRVVQPLAGGKYEALLEPLDEFRSGAEAKGTTDG